MITDPISDMLTRIRNAIKVKADKVDIPASRMKIEISKILKEEGFIKSYKIIKDKKQGIIRINLKYTSEGDSVISNLQRISKPGRRVYVSKDEIPHVMGGLGVAILTTSQGVMTDKECRHKGVGGEVICYIW
ncbi:MULTISPECIES: 30S ribosomal protein S8 [Thermodesulfovibrio]|jgi:small subunit ribosomal protein S8|uniref:Small ribosomal subunit protein uS8 n=2 Tax=Thermodesulfovibrio yellowstonii TaxID=28262 RepID=RS8_THEYD|nr:MULTISPECIES: 30S ribosomal protein S8 [Thermodesulfovibrio]B5YG33.1 RecName: Full=Small ribosomal subunit protein uS8; AltName: Full=30S ribosomal protein S8 [Thermodesulfovibrio yellowstonii DSM 11347]ACI20486.1 ribosomal protein S8 [Thermodesulfovibrio yellowstonii DSM 11347]MDI6865936.1 30S ribosomal protein S8 [Thermodesulfovibrio yellowstonii]GLI53178.1 30S ribosomal protein S8 [Thermodesulfovibrio islandicus]